MPVNRAERIAAIVLNDFHNARTAETPQRLRVPVLATPLCDLQCIAHAILYRLRELAQILAA